jgi:hypothetical protein
MIQYWKYKRESDSFNGSFMEGSAFKIIAVNKVPGRMWIRILVPGSDPPRYLKISGEEFSLNFNLYKGY